MTGKVTSDYRQTFFILFFTQGKSFMSNFGSVRICVLIDKNTCFASRVLHGTQPLGDVVMTADVNLSTFATASPILVSRFAFSLSSRARSSVSLAFIRSWSISWTVLYWSAPSVMKHSVMLPTVTVTPSFQAFSLSSIQRAHLKTVCSVSQPFRSTRTHRSRPS